MRAPWNQPDRAQHYIATYGSPAQPKPRYRRRMEFASKLVVGDSVLDVGCGLGHLYPHIRSQIDVYKGLDSSVEMLNLAKQYSPDALFERGDAYDLSSEGEYDTVIALSLLIHIEFKDVPHVIMELWDHARHALVFTVPLKPGEGTKLVTDPYPTVITHLSKKTLSTLLTRLSPTLKRVIPVKKGAFGFGLDDFFVQVLR